MTEYSTVRLTIDKQEALDYIQETVKGLGTTVTDTEIMLRDANGRRVATLSDVESDDGSTAAELRYRASPSLSPSGDTTRKAQKIHTAVEEYEA